MKQEIRRRIVVNPHDQERWLIISKGLYNLHLTLIGQLDLIILLNLWKGESPLGGRDISHNRTLLQTCKHLLKANHETREKNWEIS